MVLADVALDDDGDDLCLVTMRFEHVAREYGIFLAVSLSGFENLFRGKDAVDTGLLPSLIYNRTGYLLRWGASRSKRLNRVKYLRIHALGLPYELVHN